MDPIITVRRASIDDLPLLLSFEQAIIEAERPFDETIRSGADVHYYDLEALIASPDAHVVLAGIDSEIIASGYAKIEDSETYLKHQRHSYLGFMYVVPEHRGKGINKRIIQELEAWSLSRGVTEMQLEVYCENGGAIKAYERSGYNSLILTMRKGIAKE